MSGDYICCLQCYNFLKEKRIDKHPPKFSISNHFAIGYLPEILTSNITKISGKHLSTVRPFAYTMTYNGGAHKSITGTFTLLYNAPGEIAVATPAPSVEEVLNKSPNRITDLFVIGLMIFAFVMMIFLSRYAKKTFKTPAKPRKVKKNSSASKSTTRLSDKSTR